MSASDSLGKPQFGDKICETCGKWSDGHFHISLGEEEVANLKAWHEAAKLSAMGAEVERTRTVNLEDRNDLLDHITSDNGHIEPHAKWRNEHPEDFPGIRPMRDDGEDFELTTEELKKVHEHLHNEYPDEEHTTLGYEHFHH
jgi:hypothetical protein